MSTPRDFYNTYVMLAKVDCEADPGLVHQAVSALCHIDALAEEVWHAKPEVGRSPRAYRTALKARQIGWPFPMRLDFWIASGLSHDTRSYLHPAIQTARIAPTS